MAYIEDWAAHLGLTALWGEVFDKALAGGRKMDDE
jgi:hypothetical protein